MRNTEFESILQQMLQGKTKKTTAANGSAKTSFPSQETLHSEMFWTSVSTFERPEHKDLQSVASTYLKRFRQGPSVQRPATKPLPFEEKLIIRTLHELNQSQRAAWSYFKELGQALRKDFIQDELTSAFRQLALIHHPDHGGQSDEFMKLHNHYRQLKRLFK